MSITSFHRAFLFLAVLLLSLHSLVPHVHDERGFDSGEVTADVVASQDGNWLSMLQDFFSETDLGEDHLEYFSADHDLTLDLDAIALLPPVTIPVAALAPRIEPSTIRRQRVFRNLHFPPTSIFPDTDSPRGPPTLA